jgi:hypothetical protein
VEGSKQSYTEQDDHMTKRKMKIMSSKAIRIMPTSVMPSKVSELVRNLVHDIDVLGSITNIQTTVLEKIYLTKTG